MRESLFVRVGEAAKLVPGQSWAVAIGRYEIALFNVGGEFYALENVCPHQGAPISDGWVENRTVTCPWHAWCFDLRSGKMTLGDFATIPRFEVRQEQGSLFVSSEPIAEP